MMRERRSLTKLVIFACLLMASTFTNGAMVAPEMRLTDAAAEKLELEEDVLKAAQDRRRYQFQLPADNKDFKKVGLSILLLISIKLRQK
jgi:hypothetical protein